MFAGTFAPDGWFLCHGQVLDIFLYETLFQLIGTTYGGDGQKTFALPDLRGRIPVHMGTFGANYPLGESGGAEKVALTVNQIPSHAHIAQGILTTANRRNPRGAVYAIPREPAYGAPGATSPMLGQATGSAGGSQSHNNLQPFLCINFIIAHTGIFPSQS